MKLAVLVTFLWAGTALAAPSFLEAKSHFALEQRAIKRLGSDNWSGALVHEADADYKSVTAEMTIPQALFPNGFNKSATYSSSVGVRYGGYNYAIDGYNSKETGVLVTGFYYLFDSQGDAGVYAFHEWSPDGAIFFEDEGTELNLEMGDKIRITAAQTSSTSGSVHFENLSKNTQASKDLTAPAGGEIDTSIAAWIIESFAPNTPTDLDFGTMVWENMAAVKADGSNADLANADLANAYFIEAFKDSETTYITDVTVQPPDGMVCKWVG